MKTTLLPAAIGAGALLACQLAIVHTISVLIVFLALLAGVMAGISNMFAPSRRFRAWSVCKLVVVRWGVIVAGLMFIAFAFDVGEVFSRPVMVTWFAVTPVALCAARGAWPSTNNR